MVAKVNSGQNILGLLNYNENKVKEGVAKCIHENLFGRNVGQLNFYDKLKLFQSFINRNNRASIKAVHVSLNFHPSEKLQPDTLKGIATRYMEGIGFGSQPYLVYQHFDAAHPHIHIVSTSIQQNGNRIPLFRIGKYASARTRKEIEFEYDLIQAKGRKTQEEKTIQNAPRAVYGKMETKRVISNAVRYVTENYKYTSIPELNAVLRQHSVIADMGKDGSQMKANKGLIYRVTDENGKPTGVGIKASLIYGKPTLKQLEKNFKLNEVLRKPYKERLINCIEGAFGSKQVISKSSFIQALCKDGIAVLLRQNDEGRVYGLTFVDNKTKVVFNGSDLGKAYGAKAITDRLTGLSKPDSTIIYRPLISADQEVSGNTESTIEQTIRDLTTAKQLDFASPYSATKRRRRKKRRGRSI